MIRQKIFTSFGATAAFILAVLVVLTAHSPADAQKSKVDQSLFDQKIFTGKRIAPDVNSVKTFGEIVEYDKTYEPPSMEFIIRSKGKRPRNPPAEIMPNPPASIFKENPGMFFDYDKYSEMRPEGVAVVSPTPNDNFQAIGDANTSIPPDTHGAVGPNHLMTALNTEVRIQNKSGGIVSTVSLNSFFFSVGGGSGTFDPRIIYDQMSSRWIAVAVDDAGASTSKLLIAVSQTTDPTGTWNFYGYDHDGANIEWADYPMVGYNKDWIAIGINDFTNSGNSFSGANMYVFDKSTIYSGAVTPTVTKIDLGTGIGNVHQPTETFDDTISTLYVLQRWGSPNLRIHTITGPVGAPVFTATGLFPSTSAWNDGVVASPQNGSAVTITTNDTRMQSVIYRNGFLWAAHTIGMPSGVSSRTSVQWWQIVPTTGTVAQVGRIDDTGGTNFYAFPSIGVNSVNQVLIGYTAFSASTFASAAFSYRGITDATTTTQDPFRYKNGIGCYNKTFGGGTNRWGDYSHLSIDPTDDTTFWALQEYAETPSGTPCATNTGRWGTWWAKLIPPCASIVASGSWSAAGTWGCGGEPTSSQDAVIVSGQTVNLDVDPAAASINVNSGGTLAIVGARTVGTDIKVNGNLDLTAGILNLGTNTLKIGCGGTVSGASATGYVVGKVEKEFCAPGSFAYPVGENGFSPALVNVVSLSSGSATLTIDVIDSTLAGVDNANSASRTWELTGSGMTADLSFTYLDADVNGNESNYRVFKKIGAATPTDQCGTPCVNTGTNTATATAQTSFSQWGVGALAPTAAAASVSGRVLTFSGYAIANALIKVVDGNGLVKTTTTNQFGNYRFDDLATGSTYTFLVVQKEYSFQPQIVTVSDDLTGFDLVATP